MRERRLSFRERRKEKKNKEKKETHGGAWPNLELKVVSAGEFVSLKVFVSFKLIGNLNPFLF